MDRSSRSTAPLPAPEENSRIFAGNPPGTSSAGCAYRRNARSLWRDRWITTPRADHRPGARSEERLGLQSASPCAFQRHVSKTSSPISGADDSVCLVPCSAAEVWPCTRLLPLARARRRSLHPPRLVAVTPWALERPLIEHWAAAIRRALAVSCPSPPDLDRTQPAHDRD